MTSDQVVRERLLRAVANVQRSFAVAVAGPVVCRIVR